MPQALRNTDNAHHTRMWPYSAQVYPIKSVLSMPLHRSARYCYWFRFLRRLNRAAMLAPLVAPTRPLLSLYCALQTAAFLPTTLSEATWSIAEVGDWVGSSNGPPARPTSRAARAHASTPQAPPTGAHLPREADISKHTSRAAPRLPITPGRRH